MTQADNTQMTDDVIQQAPATAGRGVGFHRENPNTTQLNRQMATLRGNTAKGRQFAKEQGINLDAGSSPLLGGPSKAASPPATDLDLGISMPSPLGDNVVEEVVSKCHRAAENADITAKLLRQVIAVLPGLFKMSSWSEDLRESVVASFRRRIDDEEWITGVLINLLPKMRSQWGVQRAYIAVMVLAALVSLAEASGGNSLFVDTFGGFDDAESTNGRVLEFAARVHGAKSIRTARRMCEEIVPDLAHEQTDSPVGQAENVPDEGAGEPDVPAAS